MPKNIGRKLKIPIVETLPSLADAEEGELYYDITNGRLYIRRVDGWKYCALAT